MILADAQAILQRMLDPMPLDTFLDEVLGRRFVKLEGKLCAHRRDLLGADPEHVILQDFSRLAPELGCHAAAPLGPPPGAGPVSDAPTFRARIAEYHARGYTVRVPKIRTLTPGLNRFLRALELVFHTPVRAEAFWSRGDAKAPVHYDDDDIVVVQLVGRKRWFISTEPSVLPNPWKTIFDVPPRLEQYTEVEVEPGDLLYLPRGTVHRVDAISDSIHASIGFVPLTLREAIIASLDFLSDLNRPLRETVGARTSAQAAASDFGDLPNLVRDAVALLMTHCKDDTFVSDALRHRSSRVIGNLEKLKMPASRIALTMNTRLRHSDTAVSHLVGDAVKIDFAYPGGHHYIPRSVEQSLVFVARTPEFRIADIPGAIGDDVRIALANKLVSCGFLEVAGA